MSGLFLDVVGGGRSRPSAFGSIGAAYPGTRGTDAGATPQGPLIAGKGLGTFDGTEPPKRAATGVLTVGTLAFVALVAVWCALPA